ncbi:ATpase PilT family [Clostridium aceticum]|uniref:ATpase PilT family n=1 Tax=Clostridium aceticum TaxID=84022 RepID=A0A0D8IAS8_9CLOT|nr:RyR domain-containing protein [Clostridium aceticum]AKL95900.1 ATpase PilT family [Clostridium aceticum]KJF27142.1 Ryanodine receptor Ryr [Clostridium aceticum]
MKNKNIKIVVTGDICINSLQWITDPQNNEGFNWQTHLNVHNILKPGESLLLSELVGLSTDACILAPKIQDMELNVSGEFLRSTAELSLFPKYGDGRHKEKVYRVKHFLGFTGPSSGVPKFLPIVNDDENAAMVIIDDENNGFNLNAEFWPSAIQSPEKSPIILYKTNNTSGSSKLWRHLETNHIENTIVVINSDDLRSKGVNISKSLSWEKTAQNFLWQINNSPNLAFLANCHHLIVPFGLEGAIYYRNDGVKESRLYFLPDEFEGGFVKENQGKMYGLTSCFVAGLAQSIVADNVNKASLSVSINDGIRQGIVAAHKYFIKGFGENLEESPFPHASIFIENENHFIYKEHVQDVKIPCSSSINCSSCWYILKDKSSANLAEIAYDIVKNGEGRVAKFIPIAQFGNLKTVDRMEIESYRSIKNLMWEYISSKNTVRPLSIAIFGTPGSGKSFGVTEIAASIAPKLIKKLDFNLSQFRSPSDLINAFHRVRDYSLQGRIPLVFFDEFDSSFEGKLGWLKYFLAPMQDGVFREGEATHPIGKAILVFAGGTASTFKEFWGKNIPDENQQKQFLLEFKNAKGPDFVSRLRGYVNILGVNQTNDAPDQLFIIRRAMLLRSFLQRKVPHLINDKGEAQIDNGVLRALLKVPRYKHESRSMEAILEMSMLTEAKKWEQSHLPSREQLKLHVDEEQFIRHMMHDSFYSERIENLAIAAHEKYISLYADNQEIDPCFVQPWQYLSEYLKDCSRDQAKHIPDALLKINYDVVSVKEKPPVKEFTDSELKILAAYEHTRWSLHRKEAGWKYGAVKDHKKKTEPALVSWDVLPEEKKMKLYQIVKIWPEILANANFAIEQLTFSRNCEALG